MAEAEKTTLKTRIGLVLIVLGFISPLFGLLVPLFNLSPTLTATIVTALVVGGPEIFLIAGAALAGKEGVVLVKNRIKRMLGLPEGRYPATKSQYNTGLVLILVWFILSIAVGYIPGFFNVPFIEDNLLWISLGFDILFIVAIFGFGGHQLIIKLGKVFTWEPWELPPEKEKKK